MSRWLIQSLLLLFTISLTVGSIQSLEAIQDFSAKFKLSLLGPNGGIFTGTIRYSWHTGYVQFLYKNDNKSSSLSSTEQFFVPQFGAINTTCAGMPSFSCLSSAVISSTATSDGVISYSINTPYRGIDCRRRWGFEVPECIDSVTVSGCTAVNTTLVRSNVTTWGDSSCMSFDYLGWKIHMTEVPQQCLGLKKFNVTMKPRKGYGVVPSNGYLALAADSWDHQYSCLSCQQTVFSCIEVRTPVRRWTRTNSANCSIDIPEYSQPVLWYDPSYYYIDSNSSDVIHYVRNDSLSSTDDIVSEIWMNKSTNYLLKALFSDNRLYEFDSFQPASFTQLDFLPSTKCLCYAPMDISIVLELYTCFKHLSEQRLFAMNLTQQFFINPSNVQFSINYASVGKVVNMLSLLGGGSPLNVNNALLAIVPFYSYLGSPYDAASPGSTMLSDRVTIGIKTLEGSRMYSKKVLVIFYDGFVGNGDDGDDAIFRDWDGVRSRYSPGMNSTALNLALRDASSKNITVYFILIGKYTAMPSQVTGPYRQFHLPDHVSLLEKFLNIAADICSLNNEPCGDCCGLCFDSTCQIPFSCPSTGTECHPVQLNNRGCCVKRQEVACFNDPSKCIAGLCTSDEKCTTVSCPPNNECYNYTCNGNGSCVSQLIPSTDPCFVNTCTTTPQGILQLTPVPACIVKVDACYNYSCDRGNCIKQPINVVPVNDCQELLCTPKGWRTLDLQCQSFPELCLEGYCNQGECLLRSTCTSIGCINRTCVGGSCVSSSSPTLCPNLQNCLLPQCDENTGDCTYQWCPFQNTICNYYLCFPNIGCIKRTIIIPFSSQKCHQCSIMCTTNTSGITYPNDAACNFGSCTSDPFCFDRDLCPHFSGLNNSACSVLVNYTTLCNYRSTCSQFNAPGTNTSWVFSDKELKCVPVPVTCTPTIPGCTTSEPFFDVATNTYTCLERYACLTNGCPAETCDYRVDNITKAVMGVCKPDPNPPCVGQDKCFACAPGTCDLKPLCPMQQPSPCVVSSCSLTDGCVFTPVDCDDGDGCTSDSCDLLLGCVHVQNCSSSDKCTLKSCDLNTKTCVTTTRQCNDNNRCTIDTCDPILGCLFIPSNTSCDDKNPCTNDSCDPSRGCVNNPFICPRLSHVKPCSIFTCVVVNNKSVCMTNQLDCVSNILEEQPAVIAAPLAVAAIAGIVVAAVVMAGATSGVTVFVYNYVTDTPNVIEKVHENPSYKGQAVGKDNPLHTELTDD